MCIDGPAGESLRTQLGYNTILVNNTERNLARNAKMVDESLSTSMLNHLNSDVGCCDCSYVDEVVKTLEHRMNEKIGELSHEIEKLKLNNSYNAVMSQVSIQNIIQENASLKSMQWGPSRKM